MSVKKLFDSHVLVGETIQVNFSCEREYHNFRTQMQKAKKDMETSMSKLGMSAGTEHLSLRTSRATSPQTGEVVASFWLGLKDTKKYNYTILPSPPTSLLAQEELNKSSGGEV